MRVAIVSRIFTPEPSAASFMLDAIATAFVDAGHEVRVITTRAPRGTSAEPRAGMSVRRAPVLRDSRGYVRGYLPYLSFDVPLFFRLIFGKRQDLYIVEPPPTTGAVMRLAAAILRRPYLYDAADVWSDAARQTTNSAAVLAILQRMEVFAWRGASHKFTISAGVAQRMRELGDSSPTTVLGFGVDERTFRFLPAEKPESPYIVYAGSYSEWHGADIFVDALAQMRLEHPDLRLLFVGNGSDRAAIDARIEAIGMSGIEFREAVSGAELNRILCNAQLSVASLKPGAGYDYAFTTKVYASLAAGCQVLFTGVGPTADFIDAGMREQPVGIAVDYSAESVASGLRALLSHPLPPETRSGLGKWARTHFALSSIARRAVAIAEKVAAS